MLAHRSTERCSTFFVGKVQNGYAGQLAKVQYLFHRKGTELVLWAGAQHRYHFIRAFRHCAMLCVSQCA
jgi:hypothetical protein